VNIYYTGYLHILQVNCIFFIFSCAVGGEVGGEVLVVRFLVVSFIIERVCVC
jgi:hypothetical protein